MNQSNPNAQRCMTVMIARGVIALSLMLVSTSSCFAADDDGCSNANGAGRETGQSMARQRRHNPIIRGVAGLTGPTR